MRDHPAPQAPAIHATALVVGDKGILLRGKPGTGKSDLALRLLDMPGHGTGDILLKARLVGDDQIYLWRENGNVFASPPPALAGLLEVRGMGLLSVAFEQRAQLHLVVDLEHAPPVERMPLVARTALIAGLALPRLVLDPRLPSAPAQVRAALCNLCISPLQS